MLSPTDGRSEAAEDRRRLCSCCDDVTTEDRARQETPGRVGRQLGWLPASARLVDTRRKAAKEQRRRESRRRLTRLIIVRTQRGAISPESRPTTIHSMGGNFLGGPARLSRDEHGLCGCCSCPITAHSSPPVRRRLPPTVVFGACGGGRLLCSVENKVPRCNKLPPAPFVAASIVGLSG